MGVIGAGLLIWTLMETRKTNRDTREIGEAQVRAYLSVTDITLRESLATNNRVKVKIELKNTGNSPAYKVCMRAYVKVITKSELRPELFQIDDAQGDGDTSVGSGSPFTRFKEPTEIGSFGTERLAELITQDKAMIVVWGRVDYFDVFHADKVRHTHFRYVCSKRSYKTGGSFLPTQDGNDAT